MVEENNMSISRMIRERLADQSDATDEVKHLGLKGLKNVNRIANFTTGGNLSTGVKDSIEGVKTGSLKMIGHGLKRAVKAAGRGIGDLVQDHPIASAVAAATAAGLGVLALRKKLKKIKEEKES